MKYYSVTYSFTAGILADSPDEAETILLARLENDCVRAVRNATASAYLTPNQSWSVKRDAENYDDDQ